MLLTKTSSFGFQNDSFLTKFSFRHHRSAVNIGTDMLELDVHLTKDKKVVVAHDLDLDRMCGIDGKTINDYNYEVRIL